MAGRIPQDFIDDLLHRTDIVDIVEERITLKRAGRNYSGLCPFHKEKTPSFSVNAEKQFYYCFGCGAGGNAVGFVMEYEHVDFPLAVETLAKRAGLEIPQDSGQRQSHAQKHRESYDLLTRCSTFFQNQLRNHPQRATAVDYLKGRGLSGQIAQTFGIGYAPPGWDNLLQELGGAKAPVETLDRTGMVIVKPEEKRCYDRFRDRIMFPILDARGRVIAFGGRVLGDEKPKYLNSPETDVFHKSQELYGLYQARRANRNLERVLIVEGYMDVVALAQFGITNAVATLGTATSEHHLQRLYKLVNEVVFCFDGDNAGRKAARRALDNALPLMDDGRQARFLFLPDGEDPDTLVRSEGQDAFNARIKDAQPLSEFMFATLGAELDLTTQEGRARLSSLCIPVIEKIPGQVLRQLMKQRLAELSGVSEAFFTGGPGTEPGAHPAQDAYYHYDTDTAQGSQEHGEPHYSAYDSESYPSTHYPQPGADYGYDNNYNSATGRQGNPDKAQYNTGKGKAFSKSANYSGRNKSGGGRYPGKQGERWSANFNQGGPTLGVSPLGRKALRWLLQQPGLAARVDFETSEAIQALQDPELNLLLALIEQLRQNPGTASALLLLEWQSSPHFALLRELASGEFLPNNEQEFIDCLHLLVKKVEETKLELLLKKNKTAPLMSDEKQLLQQLLLRGRVKRSPGNTGH